uniref:Uncharacterized protein n=1 Tax=Ditylum brightwellii TaxID=49249 RepID=A0A7S1Z5H6_9STRA
MNGAGGGLVHHSPPPPPHQHQHQHHQHDPHFAAFQGHRHPHGRPASMMGPGPQGQQGGYRGDFAPQHGSPPMFYRGGRAMGMGVAPPGPSSVSPGHSPSYRENKMPSGPFEHHARHHPQGPHAYGRNVGGFQSPPMQRYPAHVGPMPPRHLMNKYESSVPSHPVSNPASPPPYYHPTLIVPRGDNHREGVMMMSMKDKVDRAILDRRQENTVPSHLEDAASILLSLRTTMGKEGSDSEKLSDPLPEEDNTEMDSDTASLNVSNEKINLPLNMKNEDTSSYPSRLTMPNDQHELNKLHCFIRDELLEIVVSSKYAAKEGETDVDCSNRSPSPSSVADEASTSMDDANHLFFWKSWFSLRALCAY